MALITSFYAELSKNNKDESGKIKILPKMQPAKSQSRSSHFNFLFNWGSSTIEVPDPKHSKKPLKVSPAFYYHLFQPCKYYDITVLEQRDEDVR